MNDGEEMLIDVLVSGTERQEQIVDDALEAYSKHTGVVRVATRDDLIWLKEQRNSKIDQADIEVLKDDKNESNG